MIGLREIRDRWVEINNDVHRAVTEALDRLTNSAFDEAPLLDAEQMLTSRLGYPNVLLASSATAAMHGLALFLRSTGVRTAAVPSHAYPAMAGVLHSAGIECTFVPVDANLIRTPSAPFDHLGVHLVHLPWGDVSGGLGAARELCDQTVVLDVSHVVPRIPRSVWAASGKGQVLAVGSLGPGKFLSGLELGFVATSDAESLRRIAAFGAVRRTAHFDIEAPTATKLRPHPLALAMLKAQMNRLDAKLELHDATWSYLLPRMHELNGVRVVTTSTVHERLYWKCVLEVPGLDGSRSNALQTVQMLRDHGVPASLPEYLDDAVRAAREPGARSNDSLVAPAMANRYVSLPGFVDLGLRDRNALLMGLGRFCRTLESQGQAASLGRSQ